MLKQERSSIFHLPVTAPPTDSKLQRILQFGTITLGEETGSEQVSNLPSITQCAGGSEDCVLSRKMLRESMPFSFRMHLEIRKKSKSEEQMLLLGCAPVQRSSLLWVLTQALGTVGLMTPLEMSPFLTE